MAPGRVARVAAVCLCVAALVASLSWIQTGLPVQAASRADKEAGAEVFHKKGCEYCHGANAMGTEKGPDLSTVGKRLKKQQIEHQIVAGGREMPPFGKALQPDEVKVLVDFLSAKRKSPKKAD